MPHDPVLAPIVRNCRKASRFPIAALVIGLVLLLPARSALGAEGTTASLGWSRLLMALFGGLALFLSGLDAVRGAQEGGGSRSFTQLEGR